MVKDHSDSEKGNPLSPHRLLLSINSKGSFICTIPLQDNTYHGLYLLFDLCFHIYVNLSSSYHYVPYADIDLSWGVVKHSFIHSFIDFDVCIFYI